MKEDDYSSSIERGKNDGRTHRLTGKKLWERMLDVSAKLHHSALERDRRRRLKLLHKHTGQQSPTTVNNNFLLYVEKLLCASDHADSRTQERPSAIAEHLLY